MLKSLHSLTRFRDIGVLIVRIAFGVQLVRSGWPYVSQSAKLAEFISYLTTLGFPFPTVGAYLSAYTELVGGLLWLVGLFVRPASLMLVINFLVAVLLAHVFVNDTYENTYASANLLAVSFFLLFNGAGRYSIDARFGNE